MSNFLKNKDSLLYFRTFSAFPNKVLQCLPRLRNTEMTTPPLVSRSERRRPTTSADDWANFPKPHSWRSLAIVDSEETRLSLNCLSFSDRFSSIPHLVAKEDLQAL